MNVVGRKVDAGAAARGYPGEQCCPSAFIFAGGGLEVEDCEGSTMWKSGED